MTEALPSTEPARPVVRGLILGVVGAGLLVGRLWMDDFTTIGIAGVLIAAGCLFLLVSGLHSLVWAIGAAILALGHPSLRTGWASMPPTALAAQCLVLVALTVTQMVCVLAVDAMPQPRAWTVLGCALTSLTSVGGYLLAAPCAEAAFGWIVLSVPLPALLAGTLALKRRRLNRERPNRATPTRFHIGMSAVLAVLTPVVGLLTAMGTAGSYAALPSLGFPVEHDGLFREPMLSQWTWPSAWLTLPLAVLGIWLLLRRSVRLSGREPPVMSGPLLVMLALTYGATLSPTLRPHSIVLLTVLTLLLAMSAVAGLFEGLLDCLILRPPEDDD